MSFLGMVSDKGAIQSLIKSSQRIAVLTGAGVSVDSGIPDFKSTDKSWAYPISRQAAISTRFFRKDPQTFWTIYRELFVSKIAAEPNDFHYYLTSLERDHTVTILTQNVDGLHTKAGSTNVLEIHGSTQSLVCMKKQCRAVFQSEKLLDQETPVCEYCGSILKPDVCLFDENVRDFKKAEQEVYKADLIIVAGTALDVMPFNTLPFKARHSKVLPKQLWINIEEPPENYRFSHSYIGSMKDFLKEIAEKGES